MYNLRLPLLGQAAPNHKVFFPAKRNEHTDTRQISDQFNLVSVDRKTTVNTVELNHVKHNDTSLAKTHCDKLLRRIRIVSRSYYSQNVQLLVKHFGVHCCNLMLTLRLN